MRTQTLFPILILILLFSVVLCASQEKSEDQEKEQRKTSPPETVWEQVIPVYTFSPQRTDLFDFGSISASIKEGPGGISSVQMRIPQLKSITDKIIFSFYIRPTIYGSPGLDGFALPRNSLNMNPVTGWYYWDF
jgi:hypothetical protein